jgi:hypothetical protein
MKMNTKLALAAGVLAMSVAGQASALINTTGGLTNDLVLSVWDPVSMTSYTRGLGVNVQSFLTGAGVTFGGTNKAPVITATGDTNAFSLAADANLATFLTANAANAASFQWSVIGGGLPTLTYGTTGFATTAAAGLPVQTSAFTTAQASQTTYLAAVNPLMAVGSVAGNTDSVTVAAATGGAAYFAAAGNGMGNNFGGAMTVLNTAGLGQSMNFYFLTPTANTRGQMVGNQGVYNFSNAGGASTWSLAANGTLSYAVAAPVVAAVPEPGEWALMLSGLALIGFIATRRKEDNGVTFA